MTEYYFIKQKRNRKHIFAVWLGDHRKYARFVCGFPCEKAAKAFCAGKNEELKRARW